jgi:uncharacterized protein YjiS (DUF1127 family)
MSMTLTALVAPEARAARSRAGASAVSRGWAAHINWRIEHAAIAQLCARSDRKLKGICIGRSEIESALRGRGPEDSRRPRTCGQLRLSTPGTVMRTRKSMSQ